MSAGLMAFIFFGDDSMHIIPSGGLNDFIHRVQPVLHFYWVPIVVSCS